MNRVILRILFFMLVPTISFSDIGKHNITVNFGGNFSYDMIDDNGSIPSLWISPKTMDSFVGGGFNLEFGHLFLNHSYIIHAVDTRVSVGMNFSELYTVDGRLAIMADGANNKLNTTSFSINTTYSLGREIGNGRILVDIIGLGIGYLTSVEHRETTSYEEFIYSGHIFTLTAKLPMGIQYIFDNGVMFGFKHGLTFTFSKDSDIISIQDDGLAIYRPSDGGLYGIGKNQLKYLSYNLTFSVGYVFGL